MDDDVDGDGKQEIVTGGNYYDSSIYRNAQLCVWSSASLANENVLAWKWGTETYLTSVATGNVDADGLKEIVTGGSYFDGTRDIAQLCICNGASLTFEDSPTWYWTGSTYILSVAVGNVDGDAKAEIATGGTYFDGTRWWAQLCTWE
jgi:hypothetical protein